MRRRFTSTTPSGDEGSDTRRFVGSSSSSALGGSRTISTSMEAAGTAGDGAATTGGGAATSAGRLGEG